MIEVIHALGMFAKGFLTGLVLTGIFLVVAHYIYKWTGGKE